jgi:hypothetical protein
VVAVVFPTAKRLSVGGTCPASVAEITIVPALNPTETMPAPEIVSPVSAWLIEVAPVWLPTAVRPMEVADAAPAGAEITTLDPLMPTLTIPAPSKERELATATPEVVEAVVFPTA